MAQSIRFELLGDASSLQNAFSEATGSAEAMEGALGGLEESVETLIQGQVELNEVAGRWTNESGDFISSAEAQERALKDLNSVGVESTQQVREQIERLESLRAIYADDAKAASELSEKQQRLRTELAEAGQAFAQQNRDLSRLDQEFSEATVAMADFSKRQERLQQELRATAAAQDRVSSSGVTMRSSVQASASNLSFELVQASQDATHSLGAVANQIPLMAEQFSQLQSKTGSTTGALFALRSSLLGPAGIIGAITLGLPLVQQLTSSLFEAGEGAESFSDSADKAADSVFRLREATQDPIRLGLEQARQSVELLSDDLNELREIRERLLSPSSPEFAAAAGAVGTPSGSKLEPRPTEALEALRERETISENTQNRLDEIIQQREDLNTLLRVQRRTLAEGSEITKAQVRQIQEGTASTEALVTASEEGVVRFERLSGLPDDLLGRYQSVNQLLRGQNRLVDENLVTQEQVTEELASRLEDAENIQQVQQRLNTAVEDGLITREQMQAVMENIRSDTEDTAEVSDEIVQAQRRINSAVEQGIIARKEAKPLLKDLGTSNDQIARATARALGSAEGLRQQITVLLGPQGKALAQARRTKEQYQRQAEALKNVNRLLARRAEGQDAEQVEGAEPEELPTQEVEVTIKSFDLAGSATEVAQTIQDAFNNEEGPGVAPAFMSLEEIQKEFEVGQDKAEKFKNEAQRQIGGVINAAGQLGSALVRAFSRGEKSAKDIAATILQAVGGVLSVIPGVGQIAGPAVGALGGIIGAFEEGGLVRGPGGTTDDQIPAMLSDKEFVMRAASAQEAPELLQAMNDDPAVAKALEKTLTEMSPAALSGGRQATPIEQATALPPVKRVPEEFARGGFVRGGGSGIDDAAPPRVMQETVMQRASRDAATPVPASGPTPSSRKRETTVKHVYEIETEMKRINRRELALMVRGANDIRDQYGYNG